ncbi:MerR family transcriptional regulator [uncultured Pseudokineococcus sp.]|uniref:MerR family transcriptional regulator n=1 Tax=uncultured Pseudokineococcus sp. TaxID=1642928 RepID=UPI0026093FA2|nr:MerR family transcriptional regulator [uncultured Pseudokineococcus sp.]
MTATAGREVTAADARELQDVLTDAGTSLSVGDLAAGLRSLLRGPSARAEVPLTAAEHVYLRQHSGLPETGGPDRAQAALDAGGEAVARLVASSLSAAEVARAAGVDDSTVRHWVRRGEVVSIPAARGRRFPAFQLGPDGRPVPGLREVLAALVDGLHPLSVERFLTSPDTDLVIDDEQVSPREWLLQGGAVAEVVAVARAVGVQAGTRPEDSAAGGPAGLVDRG